MHLGAIKPIARTGNGEQTDKGGGKPRKHLTILPAIGNQPPYLVSELLGAYNATNLGVTGAGCATLT